MAVVHDRWEMQLPCISSAPPREELHKIRQVSTAGVQGQANRSSYKGITKKFVLEIDLFFFIKMYTSFENVLC